jgi:hypothetical protein
VPPRKRDDQLAMNRGQWAPGHDQTTVRSARECCDNALNFTGIARVDRVQFYPERWRHSLDGAEQSNPGSEDGIPKDSYALDAGSDLLE